MNTIAKTKMTGVIPPLVTPLRGQDELDGEGLDRLIEHVLEGGVHGLFLLGTTGEGPSLSYRLRREIVREAVRAVDGRVPVLVGVTDTSSSETLEMASFCADAGAAGVVLSAPYYYPVDSSELGEYLEHLVPRLPLPVYLYNMPSHTKAAFTPELVRRFAELPNAAGLKDSSGDMIYFHRVRNITRDMGDFSLLVGPEELLAEALAFGADGGMCGGANVFPRLYVDLYEAAQRSDHAVVRDLQAQVMRLHETVYSVGRHPSAFLKGLKCALSCLGVCDDFMAEPFHRFRASERAAVREHLENLGAPLSA